MSGKRKRVEVSEILLELIQKNDVEGLRQWLNSAEDIIDIPDLQGVTPLCLAVSEGFTESVRVLLEQGADIHAGTRLQQSPLETAIINEKIHIIPLLIQYGVDLDLSTESGAPIAVAASTGQWDYVKLLVENGANVNGKYCFEHHRTPLHFAAAQNALDMMEYLLDHGAAINVQDAKGLTPLYLAEKNDNTQIVDRLLERGAAITVKSYRNETVMDYVRGKGHLDQLKKYEITLQERLIKAEPNPTQKARLEFKFGRTDSFAVPSLQKLCLFAVKQHEAKLGVSRIKEKLPEELVFELNRFNLNPSKLDF